MTLFTSRNEALREVATSVARATGAQSRNSLKAFNTSLQWAASG